jgi:hypothetical protein
MFVATQEQKDAVELSQKVRCLKLNASAGASKTTTCTLIAEANLVPSLYLAFNKAMAEDAKGRFPDWVEVRTTHSLAYRAVGKDYRHKLQRPSGPYKNVGGTGSEVAKLLMIPARLLRDSGVSVTSNSIGCCVLATVAKFEQSADAEVGEQHVSLSAIPEKKQKMHDFPKASLRSEILKHAKKLWSLRKDKDSPILANHDTYLKLYQLSKPVLSDYQMIYLDEYQDTSLCAHDIAMQQQHAGLVAVGDTFQNIYSWRGAVNLMEDLQWPSSGLTKSFRFGQKVADLANEILRDQKTFAYRAAIVGFEKVNTEVLSAQEWHALEDKPAHITKIYRTNAFLLADAVEDIRAGKPVNICVDVGNFVRCLESGIALFKGEKSKVKHDIFVGFDNWKEVQEEAEYNKEYSRLVNMITDSQIYATLETLRKYSPPAFYEVNYSTAHKMKGLEADVVVLAEDFASPFDKSGNWIGLPQEEQNLLYVALTRAKKLLVKNNTIEEMLCYYADMQHTPTLTVSAGRITPLSSMMSSGDLVRDIEVEMVKLVGGIGLMSDLDKFVEGDCLSDKDAHWQNADVEFTGLPI